MNNLIEETFLDTISNKDFLNESRENLTNKNGTLLFI